MGAPEGYIDVAARIVEFRDVHPTGCLRPADPARPYTVETVGNKTFVVVVAAAYRTPDDPTPGIGMAWEPFPGPTNFTRDSELQNAETSAWGRALVAVLAADTKRGVASANEVRNRQAADSAPAQRQQSQRERPKPDAAKKVQDAMSKAGVPLSALTAYVKAEHGVELFADLDASMQESVATGITKGVLLDDIKEYVEVAS